MKKPFHQSIIEAITACEHPEQLAILMSLFEKTIVPKESEKIIVGAFVQKGEALKNLSVRLESFVLAHKVGLV